MGQVLVPRSGPVILPAPGQPGLPAGLGHPPPTAEEVERQDQAPQELTLGGVGPPAAEAAT